MDIIDRALVDEGPLTRDQLRERIAKADVRTQGQALVHLLFLATLRGVTVRGPMIGRDHAFVLVRDWLGPPPEIDRQIALTELARRYLIGHGPASDRDLARWAGLPLRDARSGLQAISARLDQRDDGLISLRARRQESGVPTPKLLGAFDPVLLGWVTREEVVGPGDRIVAVNGIFRPFALVNGKAAGLWKLEKGRVRMEPFAPISDEDATALNAEADAVERFLGDVSP